MREYIKYISVAALTMIMIFIPTSMASSTENKEIDNEMQSLQQNTPRNRD